MREGMRVRDEGRGCGKGMREGDVGRGCQGTKTKHTTKLNTQQAHMMLMKCSWHMPSDVPTCTARKVGLDTNKNRWQFNSPNGVCVHANCS
eukprot:11902308-Heterocapsa_arctica.AAC.1